jgi:hypothetical protein
MLQSVTQGFAFGMDRTATGYNPMMGSCERSNRPSGSKKGRNISLLAPELQAASLLHAVVSC